MSLCQILNINDIITCEHDNIIQLHICSCNAKSPLHEDKTKKAFSASDVFVTYMTNKKQLYINKYLIWFITLIKSS